MRIFPWTMVIFYDFLIVMWNYQRLFHGFPLISTARPGWNPGSSRPHGRDVILREIGRRFYGRLLRSRRLAGGWGSWGSWGLAFLGDFLGVSGVFECSIFCEFWSELVGGFKLKLIEVPNSELDCDFWEFIGVDCQLDWFSLWMQWYFNVVGRQFRCPGGNVSPCIFLSPNHRAIKHHCRSLVAEYIQFVDQNNSIRFNASPMAPIRFKRWSIRFNESPTAPIPHLFFFVFFFQHTVDLRYE